MLCAVSKYRVVYGWCALCFYPIHHPPPPTRPPSPPPPTPHPPLPLLFHPQAQEKIGELSEMREELDITKEMLATAEQVQRLHDWFVF
jgi:hypothetical protein